MEKGKKSYAIIVMAAFILANLYAILTGRESFPFTHAPMFGHYIGDSTIFYDFEFIGYDGKVEKAIYPSYNKPLQSKDRVIRRFFFNKIYGSVEESSFSLFHNDSADEFVQRLQKFFPAYFKYLHSDTSAIKTVRLEVCQYDKEYLLLKKHTIGHYDVLSKKFFHTWKNNY